MEWLSLRPCACHCESEPKQSRFYAQGKSAKQSSLAYLSPGLGIISIDGGYAGKLLKWININREKNDDV